MATIVAMPFWGKGIVQKLLNLAKKGSQMRKVGIKDISIRMISPENFFCTLKSYHKNKIL